MSKLRIRSTVLFETFSNDKCTAVDVITNVTSPNDVAQKKI